MWCSWAGLKPLKHRICWQEASRIPEEDTGTLAIFMFTSWPTWKTPPGFPYHLSTAPELQNQVSVDWTSRNNEPENNLFLLVRCPSWAILSLSVKACWHNQNVTWKNSLPHPLPWSCTWVISPAVASHLVLTFVDHVSCFSPSSLYGTPCSHLTLPPLSPTWSQMPVHAQGRPVLCLFFEVLWATNT